MEKDLTVVSSGQVMTMLQRMMEKMEQDKQELKREREQDKQEMNTRMDQMNTSIGNIKKEIVQTSNRLYFVEEAIKRSSRTSSRSTSRATTVTKIPDGTEQQSTTPLPQLRSKRIFTPATRYKHEDLETLLQGMEINNKMLLSAGDMRSNESSKIIREEFEVESELQPVHGPLDSVSVSTPRNAIDGQVTELETKQFTHFESHNVGFQDTPDGVSLELPVVDSLVLLEVVSSETQESQVDAQCLTISLNEDSPVQVCNTTFLEIKSAAVLLDFSKLQRDFRCDGPETQVGWEVFQFFSTLLGKKDVSGLERVSHVWKPLFLLVYDSLPLDEFLMLQSLQF
jgi:hypothetical protein